MTDASVSIAVVAIAFLAYHFTMLSERIKTIGGSILPRKQPQVSSIVIQRMLGFILFGVIPLLFAVFLFDQPFLSYGLGAGNAFEIVLWIGILSAIVIVLNTINAPKKNNLATYPQIRLRQWSSGLLLLSALTWIAYLAAYEFMFRGFLLFAVYYEFGIIPAIITNTAIYSLIHVPKGAKEAIGAIPLGIVLCYLTILTGNILIAFVVHVVMALSNEWLTLRIHPDMKFVSKKSIL